MRIIEIATLTNGAHRNQVGNIKHIPEGWAVVPNNLETENFPFGEIKVAEVNGVMVVTEWVATEIPKIVEPFEEPTEVANI